MGTALEDLEKELAHHTDRVVVFAGAGVACATDPKNPCASWVGLLQSGLERCRERCHALNDGWLAITKQMMEQQVADEYIAAASRIERELRKVHDGEYGRWLKDTVGTLQLNDRRTIDAVLSWKTRIATTNYDSLFEDASNLRPVVWDETDLALQVLRGEHPGILHLHGHYAYPKTVVFGIKTYEDICRDVGAQNLLRSIFTLGTIVFVGCGAGVDDPNFGGLFEWSKDALKNCQHTHYHLVRKSELDAVAKQYQGLRVTPLVYGKDYVDLGPFLENVSQRIHQASVPVPIDTLASRQIDYESQRRNLDARADLGPEEYVRRSFELAQALWKAGGRRTAALQMHSAIKKRGANLSVPDRIEFILQAVEYLLQDNLDRHAMDLLSDAEDLISHLPTRADQHARFRRLLSHCLAVRAEINKLDDLIDGTLPSASPEERARLEAERAEFHMLNGELSKAENDIGGKRAT